MTLNQLKSLSEEELGIALHIINVVSPIDGRNYPFEPNHLPWIKHNIFVKKLLDSFPRVLPEGHSNYSSLLTKLGIQHEIKYETPSLTPQSQISGSV